MDERLKRLLEELGAVLNDSFSESKQIGEMIAQIKTVGYDVFLVLNPIKKQEEERVRQAPRRKGAVESWLNAKDIKFLKSMHISADE